VAETGSLFEPDFVGAVVIQLKGSAGVGMELSLIEPALAGAVIHLSRSGRWATCGTVPQSSARGGEVMGAGDDTARAFNSIAEVACAVAVDLAS
jgi:hypothetical protein